jgi:hypothetical protein
MIVKRVPLLLLPGEMLNWPSICLITPNHHLLSI